MLDPLHDHDSNSYNEFPEAGGLAQDLSRMSLKELNTLIDSELLAEAIEDLLSMPAYMREAAILDFEEIDPVLGMKLRLELCFILD